MSKFSEKDIDKFIKDNEELMDDLAQLEEKEKSALDENERLEKDRRESTDIYRISARIKNYVCQEASLTPTGTILCNEFAHFIKAIYVFSEGLEENKKLELKELLRKNENIVAKIISLSKKYQKISSK